MCAPGPANDPDGSALFLNGKQLRATYGAVADCIGVIPQSMGELLGDWRPEASWVVSADDWRPTGYSESEMHEDLFRSKAVITTCPELIDAIVEWRKNARQA